MDNYSQQQNPYGYPPGQPQQTPYTPPFAAPYYQQGYGYPAYTPPPKKKSAAPLVIIAVVVGILLFAGSVCFGIYNSAEAKIANDNSFYFYTDAEGESCESLSKDEICNYQPEFDKYSSKVYYSTLSENDKLIYKSIVYAFENCEEMVFVPKIYAPSDEQLQDILFFLALDSPLIEQNIVNAQETSTTQITVNDILGFEHTKDIEGAFIYVENFSKEKLELKRAAIEEAEKISASLPAEYTTDLQKAEYFYDYIVHNCEYMVYDYENVDAMNFLYDTLVSHNSNCDGFTNSFSLLCNMNNIACFEKETNGLENVEGHTWNCLVLDGKYYNVDVTSGLSMEEEYSRMYFCYPDKYSYYDTDYKDILPDCTDESLTMYDCYFTTENDNEVADALVRECRNNNGKYVIAFFETLDEARIQRIIDKYLYRTTSGVSYVTEEDDGYGCHTLLIVPD